MIIIITIREAEKLTIKIVTANIHTKNKNKNRRRVYLAQFKE